VGQSESRKERATKAVIQKNAAKKFASQHNAVMNGSSFKDYLNILFKPQAQ
jgi:hypothetical protein